MANHSNQLHLLVVPYPAQGHLLPLLEVLSRLSTDFSLPITIAITPANLSLLSSILSGCPDITPLVLPFPSYPALPSGCENAKDLPSLSDLPLLVHALGGLHEPLLNWASNNPCKPTAILSDLFCGWTTDLANELGIPRITFVPTGALSMAVCRAIAEKQPQRYNPDDPDELVTFDSLPTSHVYRWFELQYVYPTEIQVADPAFEFHIQSLMNNSKSWGHMYYTFTELEQDYLDHLRHSPGHHGGSWAVAQIAEPRLRGRQTSVADEEITSWLDKLKIGSVVYVAFGSQGEQTKEMAAVVAQALEQSHVPFIWVVSDASMLPEGFQERMLGKGLVVVGWAPQVEILRHPAVGAFMNHCGWNSVLEGIAAGVVLLVWPTFADHYFHARLVVEEKGIGVRVCEGRPGSMPDPDKLAGMIREAVGEEGKEMRERAEALRMAMLGAQGRIREGAKPRGHSGWISENL